MKTTSFLLLMLLPASALANPVCTSPNAPLAACKAEAEAGDAIAQLALGTKYMYGEELPRDAEQAFSWYLKAAEQGVSPESVAYMYATGSGTEQDDQEAVKWYTKGAEQGDAVSQVNLGRYYENGTGVDHDLEKAKTLYKASCEGGNYSGCDEYKRLTSTEYSQ